MFQRMLRDAFSQFVVSCNLSRTLFAGAGLIWIFATARVEGFQKPPVITSNVDEVSIDVVAHDKHGRPIQDLQPDDLQITDDGQAAKITGLRLVTVPGIRPVSLVFDSLHGDANSVALRAAEFLTKQPEEGKFCFSIWRLANHLELRQTLTNDQSILKRALESTLKPGSKQQGPIDSSSSSVPDTAKRYAADMQNAPALANRIARDENLSPFVAGLLALVRQQATIPGRKTIVYFSEGQTLASVPEAQLQSVIGAANRARVSIYSVDASGIKPANDYNAGLGTLHGNRAPLGPNGPPPTVSNLAQPLASPSLLAPSNVMNTSMSMSAQLRERQTADYTLPMKLIADETGGSYMSETNNVFDGLRRMTQDAGSYYEATYTPGKIDYDGHFRTIQVQAVRPHVVIQARAGYYSFAPNIATDLRPFELPLLKALTQPATNKLIDFTARVFRFGPEENGSRAELVVELPFSNISYQNDVNRRLFKMHFSILALVKSADGHIVQKLSEDAPLQTASENAERVRQTSHLFDRTFTAQPGKYTLDVAVCDELDHRLGTTTVPFDLAAQPKGFTLSDLMLVDRLESAPNDLDPEDQLRYRGYRVVPELQPENASRTNQLFFTIYPDPHLTSEPQIEIQLRQHHSVLASSILQLSDSHTGRAIPVLASLSKFSIPPGTFELWAKVSEGDVTREQKLDVAIVGGNSYPTRSNQGSQVDADGPAQLSSLVEPKLLSGRQTPSEADIHRMLDAAKQRANDYKNTLPNFSCILLTRRSMDNSGNSSWKQYDTMTQSLRYIEGHEDYQILEVNGARPPTQSNVVEGVWSSGEFGEFLDTVFSPKAQAQFQWQGFTEVKGVQTAAFKYHITRQHSLYSLHGKNWTTAVAYHGFVYIDPETLTVRRVSIEAEDIPRNFPIRESALSVDYSYFSVGGEQYLLPGSATLYVREGKHHLAKNEKQFRDYRRFTGESSIKFN